MERHIVGLSGGKDSTALALLLAEREPRQYEYVCTPTGDELPEMVEHWRRLGDMLGSPVIPVTSGRSLNGEIRRQGMIPNHRARWCTRILKIEAMQSYVMRYINEGDDVTLYVGLRADERSEENFRAGAIYGIESIKQRWPLAEWGMGLGDVWQALHERGITIPERTDCARCFFQTLPEWFRLWRDYPDVYADAERQELEIGHTFRNESRDTWPARLCDLRELFEQGHKPKNIGKDRQATQGAMTGLMEQRDAMCRACSL